MPDLFTICQKCGLECETPCNAIRELKKIYDETKRKEKTKLILKLRKQLDIIDAEPDKEMEELAQKIIKKLPEMNYINDFNIKVGYVKSFEPKTKSGKSVFGDCRKVNLVYGAYLPFDFIITFYEPNIAYLNDNQLELLMWHELKHIGINERGFCIEPHDIEDFYNITDSHGTRWHELGADVSDILE